MSERRFSNDAEKLAGRLAGGIAVQHRGGNFRAGLHDYLDELQIKFNAIGDALFHAYILHAFETVEEHFVQQEEQQQQTHEF